MDAVSIAKEMVNAGDRDNSNVQRCVEHGVTMADLFGAVLMGSKGSEHFDDEMNAFLDDVAGTIGDFIGAACGNPKEVVARFGQVLIEALADRMEGSNAEFTGADRRPVE